VDDPLQLLQLTEDELFESLGRHLTARQAFPLTKSQMVERGQQWFKAKMALFRTYICPKVPQILAQDSDEKTVILSIADIIANAVIGVPPLMVAALIVKIGVKTFCQGSPAQSPK
jgi:hypothetical protein